MNEFRIIPSSSTASPRHLLLVWRQNSAHKTDPRELLEQHVARDPAQTHDASWSAPPSSLGRFKAKPREQLWSMCLGSIDPGSPCSVGTTSAQEVAGGLEGENLLFLCLTGAVEPDAEASQPHDITSGFIQAPVYQHT